MAPVVEAVGWLAQPSVGVLSLVAFLVVGIILVALCVGRKKPTNAYDVNDTKGDGTGANGDTTTKTGASADLDYSWRSHEHMPPSTLQRTKAQTQ